MAELVPEWIQKPGQLQLHLCFHERVVPSHENITNQSSDAKAFTCHGITPKYVIWIKCNRDSNLISLSDKKIKLGKVTQETCHHYNEIQIIELSHLPQLKFLIRPIDSNGLYASQF